MDAVASPVVFPVQMGGLNTLAPTSMVYPDALTATNVRWGRSGQLLKRSGFTTYNSTAMPATTRAITGISQFNRRDTTTRYTIVGTQEKLFVAPTSGAWTTLVSGLTATATDYWDFTVFNNELIGVNGVDAPQVTDGTAANTGALSAKSWQNRTSSGTYQTTGCGMWAVDRTGTLFDMLGDTSGTVYDGIVQGYDPYGDGWKLYTRATVPRRSGATASLFSKIFLSSGVTTGLTLTAASEVYVPAFDIWKTMTSITVAKMKTGYWGINNGFHVVGGTTTTADSGTVGTNYKYNPVTDTWSTVTAIATARNFSGTFNISELGYIVGGTNSSGTRLSSVEVYNPFTDVMGTAPASIATATTQLRGAGGYGDGKGYICGGDTAGSPITTTRSYNPPSDAWTTETVLNTAQSDHGCALSDYWIYAHGGLTSPSTQMQRFNTTPAAPTALYVESFKGRVFMARTSTFPSRVFYSVVGDHRQWPAFNFIDVNPDDGDWITGLFVFDGRLYVTKTDIIYQLSFTDLDAEEGNQEIIQLENVKGCVSNRSIVVTDVGVFYLAEDGFRVFDGARSVLIGEKIQVTLDGYVQSRLKYTAGVWLRAQDEIWWSVTSTGSTHDTIFCYNYRHKRWSLYSGIAAESVAAVEDANDIDQILFGTGAASDGKLYTGNTTNADNGAAISATYQTGWFSPVSGMNQFTPKALYGWANRSGNWSLTVATRARYGTANLTTDAVNLSSGTYPDAFFQDANDQRFHIQLGSGGQDLTGHAHSLVLTNANASEPFTLHGLVMTGDHSVAGGTFPV